MTEYQAHYMPEGPKGPSFWKQVLQIIKRDWPYLCFIAFCLLVYCIMFKID